MPWGSWPGFPGGGGAYRVKICHTGTIFSQSCDFSVSWPGFELRWTTVPHFCWNVLKTISWKELLVLACLYGNREVEAGLGGVAEGSSHSWSMRRCACCFWALSQIVCFPSCYFPTDRAYRLILCPRPLAGNRNRMLSRDSRQMGNKFTTTATTILCHSNLSTFQTTLQRLDGSPQVHVLPSFPLPPCTNLYWHFCWPWLLQTTICKSASDHGYDCERSHRANQH